jgi:uncharacterized protein YjbJ (UPF0337 family)
MSDKNVDEAKGRVKEAAGAITGDEQLKSEGKADQAKSTLKDLADKAVEKVSDVVDEVKAKVDHNS